MSRIGKKPITLAQGITVTTEGTTVRATGPKGVLAVVLPKGVSISQKDDQLTVTAEKADNTAIAGLARSLVSNAVVGVATGWTKTLELVGVGYRAQTTGTELTLNVGFAHPVIIKAPAGITFAVGENKITVAGVDKYMVGEVAASIRRIKKPEPYKGKGIRYSGEHIRRKVGKAGKAAGAAGAK